MEENNLPAGGSNQLNQTEPVKNPALEQNPITEMDRRKNNGKKKNIIGLVIIVIAVLVFIAIDAYLQSIGIGNQDGLPKLSDVSKSLSPTPAPTANWKTTFIDDSFSLSYPPDWTLYSKSLGNSPFDLDIVNSNNADLSIMAEPNKTKDEVENEAKNQVASQLQIRTRTIAGQTVNEYLGCLNPEACEPVDNMVLLANGKYYIISLGHVDDQKIFNQILSTIIFAPEGIPR